MAKVTIVILPFRKTHLIKPVFDGIFSQTHKDLEVITVLNDPSDGSREIIEASYPDVKFIVPGWNAWFAAGNNLAFKQATGEFIQLVNDDLILEPEYVENILKAFADGRVAGATGKLLRYDFKENKKTDTIDSTGLVLTSSGRIRDRGQTEADTGQYDRDTEVFGVCGAGCMFRKSALERVKFCEGDKCEYFDEDFFAYWEDADISWRLNRAGFKNIYVPNALGYHGRTAGQAEKGYFHLLDFIKHHKKLNPLIKRLNYQNHILMYIKNAPFIHPAFIFREIAMLGYVVLFETSTLTVIPKLLRLIPKTLRKRVALKAASNP